MCMWKAIRTTNYIESFNSDLQRYSNHRILFNSESNEIIVLTACIADYNNTASKKKEKYISELSEEEKSGKYPTGILHHDTNKMEYCKAYKQVQEKAQAKKGGAK